MEPTAWKEFYITAWEEFYIGTIASEHYTEED